MLNYRQYIINYIISIFVEAHSRNTWSVRPCYTYALLLFKQKIIARDHRSRHPQTFIFLHINRWRCSHHYTNEFLNTAFSKLLLSILFQCTCQHSLFIQFVPNYQLHSMKNSPITLITLLQI